MLMKTTSNVSNWKAFSDMFYLCLSMVLLSPIPSWGCGHKEQSKGSPLSISNGGIEWKLNYHTLSVRIKGTSEREIMKMETPPLDFLLDCLSDTNKWQVAHVLLSYRYEKSISSVGLQWSGLDPSGDVVEIKKIKDYWHKKKERGELKKPFPVFPCEYLNRVFGVDESPETATAKKEQMEAKNRQWALDQFGGEVPPLDVLLDALQDMNKWRAANVLLMVKYEPAKYTIDRGESLFADEKILMKQYYEYWQGKAKQGIGVRVPE
jgi:hypothetical protein